MIEVLEAKFKAFEKHVHYKFEASEKALKIQAQEYERRLENLNHEAERLRLMQETYLPREVAKGMFDSVIADIKALRVEIKDLQKSRDEGVGKMYIITVLISAAIATGIAIAVRVLVG